jgi:hypothetical protein
MKKLIFILSIITFGIVLNSCNKDDATPNATYPYNVKMTDAPGPYNAVNIDLVGVEVIHSDGQVVTLDANAHMYDLLDLSNGVNTLIAASVLNNANVSQIRLILGPNNSVVVDNVTYPLSTPSAEQSGLKVLVNQTLQANVDNTILIDFDANQSVVNLGNGSYKLKPVLRTIVTNTTTGSIKGNITPIGTMATVSATSSTGVTYSSNVDSNGNFQIMSLPVGTYSVTITPPSPLVPIILENVVVQANIATDIGVTNF